MQIIVDVYLSISNESFAKFDDVPILVITWDGYVALDGGVLVYRGCHSKMVPVGLSMIIVVERIVFKIYLRISTFAS